MRDEYSVPTEFQTWLETLSDDRFIAVLNAVSHQYYERIYRRQEEAALERQREAEAAKAARRERAKTAGPRERHREWPRIRKEVLARDGAICHYCGVTRRWMQVDHVVPRTKGGTDDLANLVVACRRCNSSKGNRDLEEWQR